MADYYNEDDALRGTLDDERKRRLAALARAEAVNSGTLPDGTPISDYTDAAPAPAISGREEFGLPPTSPYGGNKFGGQKFGGNTYGGNTYGGNTYGASAAAPDPAPVDPAPAGPSPYGNQKFGGNTFGGNTYGGNTYGGQTFGGNKFGASAPLPASDPNDLPPVPAPSGREQFGLPPYVGALAGPAPGSNVPPLPGPTQINAAPGDNATSVPMTGYRPTPPNDNAPPPPSATPAGAAVLASIPGLAPQQSGGSGYGDAISGLGALASSLWKMGQPGIRDHGGDLDSLTNLPATLQQNRFANQRLAAGDMELQQQQAVRQHMNTPEFAKTFAGMPQQMQGLVAAAAKAGDYKTIAGVLAQQARYSAPINLGQGWSLDRASGIASNLTTGQHAQLGANGGLVPISMPGAQPGTQGGNAPSGGTPAWATDLPAGVDVGKLAAVPENIRNRAVRVINGLDPMPTSARNNPMNQAVIDAVSAAHPNFDPAAAKGAGDMIKRVSSGDISNELTNFATVHDHAAELADASKALNNGDLVAANKILNNLGYQSGSTAQVAFNNIKNAYSHELAGVLSKGHITDSEVAQANAGISSDMSPAQIAAAMQAGQRLMQDKVNQRYATAYTAAGKRIDPYFERFGLSGGPQKRQQSEGSQPSSPAQPQSQPAPKGGSAADEMRKRGLL